MRKTLLTLLLAFGIGATLHAQANYVLELDHIPTASDIAYFKALPSVLNASPFLKTDSSYFNRLMQIEVAPTTPADLEQTLRRNLEFSQHVKSVELVPTAELQSIEPTTNPARPTQDPLVSYQWGLWSDHQIVHRDLDDIRQVTLTANSGNDIDWIDFKTKHESEMKRVVKVAVIDSGVSLEHPDLKDQILPGWNYTTPDLVGNDKPYDDLGHGTHVAGIIAASADNNIGVTGLSSKIKIIPIKVLSSEAADSNEATKPKIALADRVAQGILFAINNGADVINMSLGWPASMDAVFLRNAVRYAQTKGIVVVAAAGNNSHNQAIFPCSYTDVICVGATSADGTTAPFSNYGGHVDVTAPGDQILSTIPTKLKPQIFKLKGYDIMNGTSQSAPYVSGSFAILKALFPTEDLDLLRARVFSSSKLNTSSPLALNAKESLYGRIQLNHAIEAKIPALVFPNLKAVDSAHYAADGSFTFKIDFKNIGLLASGTTHVQISFKDQPILLSTSEWDLPSLNHGVPTSIEVTGILQNLNSSSLGNLTLTLTQADGSVRVHNKSINWVRDLALNGSIAKFESFGFDSEEKVGIRSKNNIFPVIESVGSVFPSQAPTTFLKSDYKKNEDNTYDVTLSTFDPDLTTHKMVKNKNVIIFSKTQKVIYAYKIDANYDGKEDLLVAHVDTQNGGIERLNFCYFTADNLPLYSGTPCLSYTLEKDLLSKPGTNILDGMLAWKKFNYLQGTLADGSKIALPVFVARGVWPESDKNPNLWSLDITPMMDHLYTFVLSATPSTQGASQEIILKTVDTYAEKERLRALLGLEWNDGLKLVSQIPQNQTQYYSAQSTALLGYGRGFGQKNLVISFSTVSDAKKQIPALIPVDLGELKPSNLFQNTLISIDARQGYQDRAGLVYTGVSSTTTANAYYFDFSSLKIPQLGLSTFQIPYQHPNPLDSLLYVSANYKTEDTLYSIYFSKNKMVMVGRNFSDGALFSDTFPLYRYSFLPGRLFNELYNPMSISINGIEVPAYSIDRSQINTNQISLVHIESHKLQSYASLNFSIPTGCAPMNPGKFKGQSPTSYLVLLCDSSTAANGTSWEIRSFPLEIIK